MKLAVPRWTLVQVGKAIAPRLNAFTSLKYTPVDSFERTHNGGSYDFFRSSRAPLNRGEFSHSGGYQCCQNDRTCVHLLDELDIIQASKGMRVPMLFFKDYTCCPPSIDCCFQVPACGIFAWAYGKVLDVGNDYSVDDYTRPDVVDVSISGVLESPLREVTYDRWRYGTAQSKTDATMTEAEFEASIAEPQAEWYIPCDMPQYCNLERFFPRNLLVDANPFEYTAWPMRTQLLSGVQQKVISIWGNTAPRTLAIVRGGTTLTIEGEYGTEEFTYEDVSDASFVYTDTDTSQALELTYAGETNTVHGIARIPRLGWYENRVSIDRGWAVIGHVPQWIN